MKKVVKNINSNCRDSSYKSTCLSTYTHLPYCKKEGLNPTSFCLQRRFPGNITLSDIFGIKDIMDIRGSLKIKASGWCMFPNIHNEDTLNVKKVDVNQIKVGDAVVFKNWNRFVCHRVIDKVSRNGEGFVLTRPDRAKSGNDGPLSQEDIVGRVDSVNRKGKLLKADKRIYTLKERIINNLILLLYELKNPLERKLLQILSVLQRFSIFRGLAKAFFFNLRKRRKNFIVSIPTGNSIKSRFYIYRKLPLINIKSLLSTKPKFHLIAYLGGHFAGYCLLVRRPKGCPYNGWWIGDIFVRGRYRGIGIGSDLLKGALDTLKNLGVKRVRINIPDNDLRADRLVKNFGFNKTLGKKDIDRNIFYKNLGSF